MHFCQPDTFYNSQTFFQLSEYNQPMVIVVLSNDDSNCWFYVNSLDNPNEEYPMQC